MRPAVLGLVADDLTGAGDAAVGFAEAGWDALLSLRPSRLAPVTAPGPTVLAVTTGSRAAPDDEAAARTARAVEGVVAAGAERLYLKIDSTVRGSVAGQVDGALTAWSAVHPGARAVICPAFPAHLRTVVDGHALVAGAPLAASAAAHDPVTPRTSGDLVQVFPGAERRAAAAPLDVSGPPGSRLLVDAHGDPDLDELARGLDAAGPAVVMVGSGGLAAALGRRWSQPAPPRAGATGVEGRVLVAVSSLHPATAAQLQQLRTGPSATVVEVITTRAETTDPVAAAAELARRVRTTLAEGRHTALVAVGGDGAAAILLELAADGVEIVGAVVPGCPTGYVSGGFADGLRLVTKSGGFGSAAALDQIVRRLRTTRADLPEDHLHAGPRPSPKEAP